MAQQRTGRAQAMTERTVEALPRMTCCLYRHFDKDGALLYVGVSLSAVQRLAQHRDASHWFSEIASVKIEWFADRKEALAAERAAITAENPRHNLYRPTIKEVSASRSEESRQDLIRRLVQFNPTYSRQEAAEVLGVGTGSITQWMDEGKLGYVQLGPKRRVTGWHLIDFLESREAEK